MHSRAAYVGLETTGWASSWTRPRWGWSQWEAAQGKLQGKSYLA